MCQSKILVTGSAGAVGFHVARALLERGHQVRGFDVSPQRLPGDHRQASLLDLDALRDAAKGMEIIVHVAAVPDRQRFAESLVPNNIVGTQNVFEVARLEAIGRVINTSSVRVVGALDWVQGRIGLDAGLVPGDHYGISKATGELIGAMYARRFGMTVLSVRLGWFVRNRDEARLLESIPEGRRIYVSHDDAAAFYVRAVERPDLASGAVYVTSHNDGDSAFDLGPAERSVGFTPKDTFPQGSIWSEEDDFPSPIMAPSLRPAD